MAHLVDITVVDGYQNKLQDAIVEVQWHSTTYTSWIPMTSMKTDSGGHTATYIQIPMTYRFNVSRYGETLRVFEESYITSASAIELNTRLDTVNDQDILDGITYGCSYDNQTTHVFTCHATDPSLRMVGARLIVTEDKLFGSRPITFCDNYSTGSNVVLTCNLTGVSNSTKVFHAMLYADVADANGNVLPYQLNIEGKIFGQASGHLFGMDGTLAATLIIIGITFASITNPVGMFVGLGTGTVLMQLLGILNFTSGTLMGLFAIIGFIIWRVRTAPQG